MDKNNSELFSQAISEGLSKRFDNVANGYTEEIICSDKHILAIRTIVYGKSDARRGWSPKTRRIIAILVAVALLLTSCGIIFRNEIREIYKEVFLLLTFSDQVNNKAIENIYQVSYIPEGYYFDEEIISPTHIEYKFKNQSNNHIWFVQKPKNGTYYAVDSENGYYLKYEISNHQIYHKHTKEQDLYVWTDGDYSMLVGSDTELSMTEITSIIEGIKAKK